MNRPIWPYFTLVCGIILSVVSILEVFDELALSDAGSAYFLGFAFLFSTCITIYWRAKNFFLSNQMLVGLLVIGLLSILTVKLFNLEFVVYWMKLTVSLVGLFYGLLKSSQLYADGAL